MTAGAPVSDNSNVSGGCLILFGLPFALAGLAGIVKAVLRPASGASDSKSAIVQAVLALTLCGVGIGLMLWGVAPRNAKARLQAFTIRNPEEPWLWRDDWAQGYAEPDFKSTAAAMGGAGLFCLLVSWPGLLQLPEEFFVRRHYLTLLLLVFPLTGIFLLGLCLLAFLRDRKFRNLRFSAAGFPGVLGGHLDGRIESAFLLPAGNTVSVVLSCVHSYTGGGDSSRWEKVLWQDKKAVAPMVGARGSDLAVAFQIPYDARPTGSRNSDDQVFWRISVRESLPGIDLRAVFVVPVFKTGASDPSLTMARLESERTSRPTGARPEDAKITAGVSSEGGVQFYLGPARNKGIALAMTLFGAVFVAGGLFFGIMSGRAFTWFIGVVPLAISGGIGLLLLALAFWLWFGTTHVEVVNRELHIRTSCLGIARSRIVAAAEIRKLELSSSMQQGDNVWYDLKVHLVNGRKLTAGSNMEKSEADWYLSEIKKDLGI